MNSDFPSSVNQAKTYQIQIRGEIDPALLAKLQEMGFQHLIFNIRDEYTPETLHLFTEEIIPVLKG